LLIKEPKVEECDATKVQSGNLGEKTNHSTNIYKELSWK